MSQEKNYLTDTFLLTLVVTGLMLCLSFIPKSEVLGISLRRADILSDVRVPGFSGQEDPVIDQPTAASQLEIAALENEHLAESEKEELKAQINAILSATDASIVPFEDFSEDHSALKNFITSLGNRNELQRPVRIAFLGDSFIEGDLFTCDLRQQLQDTLGGRGVGFVPITSEVAGFRETVRHSFGDWDRISLINRTPEDLSGKFLISGYIFRPKGNTWVKYETARYRNLQGYHNAQLYFINTENTSIKATINDTDEQLFHPQASENLQSVLVKSSSPIRSIRFDFTDTEGFLGYGVSLNSPQGVVVDNYSMRGNSGMPMVKIGTAINRQYDRLAHYDMIVLQYGLNIVSEGRTDYSDYKKSMIGVVQKLQAAYPEASIVIMGVGDRSGNSENGFGTMPGIKHMVKAQQEIARECGIAFWNTFSAMGGDNSMINFVEKGWAAKDYTHIGRAGGRFIARKFVDAIQFEQNKYDLIEAAVQRAERRERLATPSPVAAAPLMPQQELVLPDR